MVLPFEQNREKTCLKTFAFAPLFLASPETKKSAYNLSLNTHLHNNGYEFTTGFIE